MVTVTYILQTGVAQSFDLPIGTSVMEGAVLNKLSGIDADCGGACSCATCHVKVAEEWREVVGAPNQIEEEMLDMATDADASSRLSCQIKLSEAMDGLIVRIPPGDG